MNYEQRDDTDILGMDPIGPLAPLEGQKPLLQRGSCAKHAKMSSGPATRTDLGRFEVRTCRQLSRQSAAFGGVEMVELSEIESTLIGFRLNRTRDWEGVALVSATGCEAREQH